MSKSLYYTMNSTFLFKALDNTTLHQHDLLGRLEGTVNPDKTVDRFYHDGDGVLEKTIEDINGLGITTVVTPDSFGNAETVQSPTGVITKNTFDKCNRKKQSVVDPGGLNLSTKLSYNGSGTRANLSEGDTVSPRQYEKKFIIDGLGRGTGDTVDPSGGDYKGLDLTENNTLDLDGKVIAHTDPEGNISRTFYDANGRERFFVDASGGVRERAYDAKGLRSALKHIVFRRSLSFNSARNAVNMFLDFLNYHGALTEISIIKAHDSMLFLIASREVGNRPGRSEPRLVKRRPKPTKFLMESRKNARLRLKNA